MQHKSQPVREFSSLLRFMQSVWTSLKREICQKINKLATRSNPIVIIISINLHKDNFKQSDWLKILVQPIRVGLWLGGRGLKIKSLLDTRWILFHINWMHWVGTEVAWKDRNWKEKRIGIRSWHIALVNRIETTDKLSGPNPMQKFRPVIYTMLVSSILIGFFNQSECLKWVQYKTKLVIFFTGLGEVLQVPPP